MGFSETLAEHIAQHLKLSAQQPRCIFLLARTGFQQLGSSDVSQHKISADAKRRCRGAAAGWPMDADVTDAEPSSGIR